MTSSGLAQRIAAPGDPGCFPGLRLRSARSAARRAFLPGGLRPGRSSALGGIEEFPEFLDAARRAASSCSRSPATSDSSAAIRSPCPAICASCASSRAACSRISASRGSSGGSESVTARDHPRNHPRPPSRQPARSPTVTPEPVTRCHSKAPINRERECLRVYVSLRQELYEDIPELYDDAQKYRDLIETVRWSSGSLLTLIANRIRHSLPALTGQDDQACWDVLFADARRVARSPT